MPIFSMSDPNTTNEAEPMNKRLSRESVRVSKVFSQIFGKEEEIRCFCRNYSICHLLFSFHKGVWSLQLLMLHCTMIVYTRGFWL